VLQRGARHDRKMHTVVAKIERVGGRAGAHAHLHGTGGRVDDNAVARRRFERPPRDEGAFEKRKQRE